MSMNLLPVRELLANGKVITYKIYNGTAYNIETPNQVMLTLDYIIKNRLRCRLFYGDVKTGKDWNEENDILGYITRSNGEFKVPLLLANTNSRSGGALQDNCIVKITCDKEILYAHPNYTCGVFTLKKEGYVVSVFRDGVCIANFKTIDRAKNYIAFMQGTRNKI